ncbi:MAG: hypothetical protein WKG06_07965 [Segetibacter sp.]
MIVSGIAAIVFFVIKVMGMNSGGLFARAGGSSLPYTAETEDINRISFEDAIKEAELKAEIFVWRQDFYTCSL